MTGADVELPRVLTLLWGHEKPGRRGPKPGRSIHDIGAAAARVADSEGLHAVSMSRVAKELRLTTMALYRYVDSKDDLIVAMVDAAYGPPPPRRRTKAGWRAQLEAWARANRTALSRHSWIVQIPVGDPPLAPNQLAWMERGLAAFAGLPLTEQQKLSALLLAEVYVRGQSLLTDQLATTSEGEALTEREANERYIGRLRQLIDPVGFPSITAAMLSGSLQDENDFAEDEFLFGLQTVLDGIEALIERAAQKVRRPKR
jgi:AcrR family transcriptional regulator